MIKVENLTKTYPGKVPTPALKGSRLMLLKENLLRLWAEVVLANQPYYTSWDF